MPRSAVAQEEGVEVILVPSATGGAARFQFLTTYLLDQAVAIDAGCLGLYRTPQQQAAVRHVLLTHSHIDHLASLAPFLINIYTGDGQCPTIYGSAAVLDCLRRDLFNDRVWPDFIRISTRQPPYLRLQELHAGQPIECAGLRITPVPVNHVVPTLGFVVEGPAAAVIFPSDTGPTEEIWTVANRTPNLKGVFLEAAFPNALTRLAEVSKHLTPALFAQEVAKVKSAVRFLAVHIQASSRSQVARELKALRLPNVEIAIPGKAYHF
jgi:ribonuclease BN (tRNA processing enzyme)